MGLVLCKSCGLCNDSVLRCYGNDKAVSLLSSKPLVNCCAEVGSVSLITKVFKV